jgi:hypothetical protein
MPYKREFSEALSEGDCAASNVVKIHETGMRPITLGDAGSRQVGRLVATW